MSEADAGFEIAIAGVGRVETRSVILATGVTYRRLDVPALAELEGVGVSLRVVAVRGAAVHGRERLRRRRCQLGGSGGGAPFTLRGERDARLPLVALVEHVAVPPRRDRGQGEHPRPRSDRDRRRRRRRTSRAPDAARAGGHRDRRGGCAVHPHRRACREPTGCRRRSSGTSAGSSSRGRATRRAFRESSRSATSARAP